jgi:uncharacterized protein (DUF924 family)
MTDKMETLEELLVRTVREGAPLYNEGDKKGCYEIYMDSAKHACLQEKLHESAVGQLLEQATDEAMPLAERGDYDEAAWVLRGCFDTILKASSSKSRRRVSLLAKEGDNANNEEDDSVGYWQDETAQNTTDAEKAQNLADVYTILLSSITPTSHTRFTSSFENCFPGSEVVETLVNLGLASHRKMAVIKGSMLRDASLILSVSHESETSFHDGTRLYRFPASDEIQAALHTLEAKPPSEGSGEILSLLALKSIVSVPMLLSGEQQGGVEGDNKEPVVYAGVSMRHLGPLHSSVVGPEQSEGFTLANLMAKILPLLAIQERRHNLKTYEKCFVGSEAVTAVVNSQMGKDRDDATALLGKLDRVGLIHHVTRQHEFEDKKLFYRVTSSKDLQKALDAYSLLPQMPTGKDLVRQSALIHRLKQFAGLNVTEILNSFYGCGADGDASCWDVVDLQAWRNNMKRWGFGRREDQDDDMIDVLSPLTFAVDPDTWKMEDQDPEWSSPWGILAQIAIFDQVSRSAYRGTADAFKWDDLAIKATKYAIEKGYFETAYKSTLNQFVVLLPLEHSESWEDQKLGVTLLLQLLSTVAVQDEGLSDYEIVKRLEFSKRLATAFLEHAQVVAKFKRYPHRNKAHSRATSLEERIWLASDLVPRWAKSQQHTDAEGNVKRNLIQVPVIPLKRLTRR